VRALSVSLRQPYVRNGEALQVNVVYAREATPPADTQPIDWVLYTSEPVDTPEQLLQVLEWYRARWVIEEFSPRQPNLWVSQSGSGKPPSAWYKAISACS
jgi:hypothetical protein